MNYNLDFNNLEVLKRKSFEGTSNPSLGGVTSGKNDYFYPNELIL
ncbi:hypothetical protein ABDJ41_08010 [Pedobacter sp. ASV1-7]